jgi:hypothetical protein
MLTITEEMRESARKLLKAAKVSPTREPWGWSRPPSWGTRFSFDDHKRLTDIANGKRKLIDGSWWKEIHGTVSKDKLDKLSRLADPARNDNPHERALARAKLAGFKTKRPPGLPPEGRPFPTTPEEWAEAERRATEARKRKRKAGAGATDSVATKSATNSVATRPRLTTDNVAEKHATNSVAASNPKADTKPATDSVASKATTNSVAPNSATDSVAAAKKHPPPTDSVAKGWLARRAAAREQARAGLKCQTCNAPLNAQRPTARFCSSTCRSKAFRSKA